MAISSRTAAAGALVAAAVATQFTPSACAQAVTIERGQLLASGGGAGGVRSACISCHGVTGAGDTAAAFPRLGGLDARYVAKQLADYASGTRPNNVMTPIALSLSEADRRALGLYYASLPPQTARRVESSLARSPDRIQAAAAIYAQGSDSLGIQACANCHGRDGRGLGQTYPDIGGQPAAYTSQQLHAFRSRTRTNDIGGSMQTVAKALSNEDIEGLAAYLQVLQP